MSLKKFQILEILNSKHGISITSVQKLNKLLEEMGILKRLGNGWMTTQKGLQFSIYSTKQALNGDLWHEALVDAIAKYVKDK